MQRSHYERARKSLSVARQFIVSASLANINDHVRNLMFIKHMPLTAASETRRSVRGSEMRRNFRFDHFQRFVM